MSDTITISKEEYKRLLKDSVKLSYLEISGVDNWEWYGESFNEDYEKEIEEIENM